MIAAGMLAALLVAMPMVASAQQSAAPPKIEEANQKAYWLFCMPLVAKGATNASDAAKSVGFQPTPLPNFGALTVRSASAWLAPSSSGRVIVSRGSVDAQVPLSCEITVAGAPGSQLSKMFAAMLVCNGCPFVHNAKASQEKNGIRMDKYDWNMPEKKTLLSVLTYTLPDNSPAANFFVHVHMLRWQTPSTSAK